MKIGLTNQLKEKHQGECSRGIEARFPDLTIFCAIRSLLKRGPFVLLTPVGRGLHKHLGLMPRALHQSNTFRGCCLFKISLKLKNTFQKVSLK